ncbi:MAG TPA: ATP-binding protein [Mycetocola sp.]|jgi:signal transduction histidine kinase|uniref:sensor histidine kinase n=1 Tax=Mycetocola sp. TaxID=1871042 RepID=UPI00263876DC|nr:ATP-binding protein [Mycetocola sp.]MCU1559633.1 histidine kinase [Mycetocola sp.]HEV7848683.1 ATP-binding protein [Mycetocola sp.]
MSPSRLSTEERDRFSWQLARLLYRTTRLFGLTGTTVAAICIWLPGAMTVSNAIACSCLIVALLATQILMTHRPHPLWMVLAFSLGLSLIAGIYMPSSGHLNIATAAAISAIGAWGIGSMATILVSSWGQVLSLFGALSATVIFLLLLTRGNEPRTGSMLLFIVSGWATSTLFGIWLRSSFPRVMRRVSSIGRAHNVERRASETEAQRHRNARLLHDTVLATLTLLAHSGVGVPAEAMRAQAKSDGLLLKRLRLGESPQPRSSGEYTLTHTAELSLGGTLEALKGRFGSMGLDIEWHGSGQIGLPGTKLEAFILALSECLENVRRHSGVSEAHVTLSDDGEMVRGVVTDAGSGFDPSTVPEGKLGFADSVVARVRDSGGSVRVFSAPSAGTTVVLEMPK